jgi:hypothetical protein
MLDVYGHSHKATFVGATTSRAMNESPEFGENWALIAEAAPDTEAEATPTERVDAYGRVRTEAKSDMMERAKAILARKGRVTSEDLS